MTQVRCPACRTIFRARPEQLRARGGRVRCGRCLTPFDAPEHRVDEQAPQRQPEPAATDPQRTKAGTAPTAAAPPAVLRRSRRHAGPSLQTDGDQPAGAQVAAAPTGSRPASAAEKADGRLAGDDFETRLADLSWRRQAEEAAGDAPDTAEENGEAASVEDYFAGRPRPAHPWLWGLGIGLLFGTLAMQSLYLFREPITRQWPALRPVLVAACDRLGCAVPLPRQARHFSIESSVLESLSEHPPVFVLNAELRNQAPYPQAYPHLELTLSGPGNRTLVRRAFAPEEWLNAEKTTALEEGFQGGSSVTVELPFTASETAHARGYRLYVFYP